MNIEYIKEIILISSLISIITCTFIQKTKFLIKNSKLIVIYSLFINIIISIYFCNLFTDISLKKSIFVGIISFIGADSIFKTFEGKLKLLSEIIIKKKD